MIIAAGLKVRRNCARVIAIPSARGALVTSGVARVQPAKFVRGLADAVARLGVTIYEATRAHEISKGQVITHQGPSGLRGGLESNRRL